MLGLYRGGTGGSHVPVHGWHGHSMNEHKRHEVHAHDEGQQKDHGAAIDGGGHGSEKLLYDRTEEKEVRE